MTKKKGIESSSKNDVGGPISGGTMTGGIRAILAKNKEGGPGTSSNTRPGTGKMKATK